LARAITTVPVGAVVAVEADDPAAATDIPAWCRMTGHEHVGVGVAADGVATFRVRRVEPGTRP
jgi:tRNA 2-thiouridine synthesizing protein A